MQPNSGTSPHFCRKAFLRYSIVWSYFSGFTWLITTPAISTLLRWQKLRFISNWSYVFPNPPFATSTTFAFRSDATSALLASTERSFKNEKFSVSCRHFNNKKGGHYWINVPILPTATWPVPSHKTTSLQLWIEQKAFWIHAIWSFDVIIILIPEFNKQNIDNTHNYNQTRLSWWPYGNFTEL